MLFARGFVLRLGFQQQLDSVLYRHVCASARRFMASESDSPLALIGILRIFLGSARAPGLVGFPSRILVMPLAANNANRLVAIGAVALMMLFSGGGSVG